MKGPCVVTGCNTIARGGLGMCSSHYMKVWRSGHLTPFYGTFEERFWEKVNKTETCWVWTGATRDGYGMMGGTERPHVAHRLSYEWANGPIPEGMVIDHMCFNRACVNPAHLRVVTQKQNTENRGVLNSNNSSGIRGVSWHKKSSAWRAYVRHEGRQYWCGTHPTKEEAEAAVIAKRNELFSANNLDRKDAA